MLQLVKLQFGVSHYEAFTGLLVFIEAQLAAILRLFGIALDKDFLALEHDHQDKDGIEVLFVFLGQQLAQERFGIFFFHSLFGGGRRDDECGFPRTQAGIALIPAGCTEILPHIFPVVEGELGKEHFLVDEFLVALGTFLGAFSHTPVFNILATHKLFLRNCSRDR